MDIKGSAAVITGGVSGLGEATARALVAGGARVALLDMNQELGEKTAAELGDSALLLAARFWVNQETHNLFDVHSAVVQVIKEAAEEEEIELPYPIQTVRLDGVWPAGTA